MENQTKWTTIGRSALHHTTTHGNLKVARAPLERKADVTIQESIDWTPLHHAARNNPKEIIRPLANRGVDLVVIDSDG